MSLSQQVDLCVIGAGAAGLSVAAGAAQLGIGVVLIEEDRMGGECLNTGCVPSKALLAAAKAAQMIRNAKSFGIDAEPLIDFQRVHAHLRSVIDAIAPHDSVERFEQLGVEVIRGKARFTGYRRIALGDRELRAHRVVIATGSAPAVPQIPGLDQVPFFTNESIFDNDSLPRHLIILGAGPIGIEIGQAYRRLGAAVTIIERDKALPKDDPELARPLLQCLATEGVAIHEGAELRAVARDGDSIILTGEKAGMAFELRGSHLFIATGRTPRTSGLGLEAAGIEHDENGIIVDNRLRTTARGVYAIGDVVNGPRFTHVASYHAGIVIRNALFRLPARIDYRSLPWVTYTYPELAQVGMTEERARKRYGDKVRLLRVLYMANDRAQTERHTEGMLKLVADARGRVLGASIIGTHAGELAHLWIVAIQQKLKLRHVAQMIAPYPTWGELDKAAAAEFFKPLIARPLTRAIARTLFQLP
jgi:pyruvate/2-oxoglutarate dehydrogenase complex dihydrolipoamide dehydrogenase (E3) component